MNTDETPFSMMMMTAAAESADMASQVETKDCAASIDRRMIHTQIKTDLLTAKHLSTC